MTRSVLKLAGTSGAPARRGYTGTMAVLAAWAVFGCSAPNDLEGAASSDEAAETNIDPADDSEPSILPEILNRFTIGDETLTFQFLGADEASGDPGSIALAHDFRNTNSVDTLTRDYGMLTSLEMVLALAPEGTVPHPTLVAAHESEAMAFGRTDLGVMSVDGRGMAVEKNDQGACKEVNVYSSISPLAWVEKGGFQQIDLDGTFFYVCAGLPKKSGQGNPTGCENFHPSYLLRMAVCNDIDASGYPLDYAFYRTSVRVIDPFYVPLQPGQSRTLTMLPVANPPQPVISRSLGVTSKNAIPVPPDSPHLNVAYQRGGVGH